MNFPVRWFAQLSLETKTLLVAFGLKSSLCFELFSSSPQIYAFFFFFLHFYTGISKTINDGKTPLSW